MNDERRPQAPFEPAAKLTASSVAQPADLVGMPPDLWKIFLEGYASGFAIGVDRGRELADEDAAAIHRYAVRVVQAMARLEPWEDAQESRRARWAAAADERAS